MSYYYFVASLPSLMLAAPPPWSQEEFLAEARRLLDRDAVQEVEAILEEGAPRARSAFAARWRALDAQLRNAVARQRAARIDTDPAPHMRPHEGFSVYAEQAVVEAFAKPNPLERELSLDRFRWAMLEEWAREAPFGLPAVLAYALKLKLSERWGRYTDEQGRERLTETVRAVRSAWRAAGAS